MQEQNFEKQVQKKLEELNLSPSAPVWKKVEEQIREKKDRRRIFFWLIPVVLLGGGIYLYSVNDKPVEKTGSIGIAKEILRENNNQNSSITTPNNSTTSNDQSTTQKQLTPSSSDKQLSEKAITVESPIQKSAKKYQASTKLTANRERDENKINHDELTSVEKKTKEQNETTEIKQETNSINADQKAQNNKQVQKNEKINDINSEKVVNNTPVNNNSVVVDSSANNNTADTTNKTPSPSEIKDSLAVAVANETDTIQKAQAKTKSRKSWKLSASLAGGSSGIATSAFGNLSQGGAASFDALRFYNTTTSTQMSSGNGPIASARYPSDIKNAFSFAAGATLNKELSRRLQFSTGLVYHFYSTSISVGKKVYQADTISRENKSIRVENFYQPSNSGETDTYKNKYHLIEVPIGVEWQVVKTIPLQLQTGFRIGRLIKTSALHYDGQQGIYYEDKELFKRTQVSFYTGIFYRILKINKSSLYIGPKAQFHLSNVLKKKDFGEQHLYFTGVETYISF
jgi:hypothetical protein